jgi:hypothetical protein
MFAKPSVTPVTESGTVPAGAYAVDFVFSSDFAGTVGAADYSGATDARQSFEAPHGHKLDSIDYTVDAGSIRIAVVL